MKWDPLLVEEMNKAQFREAIHNDTLFLKSLNLVDYSLIVGVDSDSRELVVGIIDYLRAYTWDKKMETLVKSSGIMGGGKERPTVIPPKLYRTRFLEAMERYFITVPDKMMTFTSLRRAASATLQRTTSWD
mmetsp:Transcript_29482/g.76122  ORF Transcript_29482/g.76122 Transcript_29482/m.76122 type:complete len:131 (-) Transcript_29482:927-1319(-)